MIKIMFVCHGNICRSPMAEFIMKYLVEKAGLKDEFYICSSAVSTEEIGNGVYPPAKRILQNKLGIDCGGKRAVQITAKDYSNFDYIVLMDKSNIRNLKRIIKNDPENRISLLLSFAGTDSDISDPWYSGDFEQAYCDIYKGCQAMLEKIEK